MASGCRCRSSSHAVPLACSSLGEWKQLLQCSLGEEEGAAVAVAASLACCEHVIIVDDVTSSKDQASGKDCEKTDQKSGERPCDGEGHVDATTEEPYPVLHVVAAAGDSSRHLECASKIHEKARCLLTMAAPSSNGDTPLHCAARAGNAEMVAHLTHLAGEKARDLVMTRNKRGETALHEAVRFGDVKMVQGLLAVDMRLASTEANDGTSPMYLATTLGRQESRKMAVKLHECQPSYSGPRGQNALHAAVLRNDEEMTKSLLEWNKDVIKQSGGMKNLVRETDVDGSTPLHFAAAAPDPALQFALFVFSASNFERYSLGYLHFLPQRWLMKIFERYYLPVIQLLEDDPESAFQPDKGGSFPVHVAAAADSMVSLIALLTRYPACAGLRNANGQTFLHVAVEKNRLHAVKFVCHLWGMGRQHISMSVVNIQDNKGDTALHLAVRKGALDMCRHLVGNKHTLINLENNDGETPMDLAAKGVKSGFYFGLSASRRILGILTFAGAKIGSRRNDMVLSENPPLNVEKESEKIKDFAQIVGIGSVLVATATFTAALTVPGGLWTPSDSAGTKLLIHHAPPPAGTPVLAGSLAFDGFVISNTVAFICSTLATFSLVYCGVATVDIDKRLQLVAFSLALLLCSARSFCAALAFALFLLLAKVSHGTAIASCVMTSLALLDGLWFLLASFNDTSALLFRDFRTTLLKFAVRFVANVLYLFWPYLLIGGYMVYDFLKMTGKFRHH